MSERWRDSYDSWKLDNRDDEAERDEMRGLNDAADEAGVYDPTVRAVSPADEAT